MIPLYAALDLSFVILTVTLKPPMGAPSFRVLCERVGSEYPQLMAVNWLEVAKKMAEDARAQLALNRKRLQEIRAERARQRSAQEPQTNAR